MTKVASVKVIGLAACIAIVIGFLGKFTALVSTIPGAVLGGVSLLLYGFIAVNGLKVLIKNQVNFEDSKNVVVASSMLVLGLGGATISIISGDFSLAISGMSLASIVGIILNLILPNDRELLQNERDWDIPSDTEAAFNTLKKEFKAEVKEVKETVKKKTASKKKTTTKKTSKKK
jgi:xanthine/uracil permease